MDTRQNKYEEYISIAEFQEFRYQKIVPLEDLTDSKGVPLEKSFPYWRRHNLLPFIQRGKWVKLTFAQLIWLRMLDTLRSFGFTIENTQKLCDYLFADAVKNNLPEKNIKDNRDQYLKKKLAGTITENEHKLLKQIEEIVADKVLLDILKPDINYLTNLISECLAFREETGILIFQDGEFGKRVGSDYFSHRLNIVDPEKPHIYLSIKYFLKEIIESEDLEALIVPHILNENEKNVLRELRDKNIHEIVIKRTGKNELRIESSSNGLISGEKMDEIKRILGLRNYEEINISTRDEKTLSFKKTKKKIKTG